MDDIFIALSMLILVGLVRFNKSMLICFNEILEITSENKSVWNLNGSFIPT